MPSAALALQKALFARLSADAPLIGLLGAARIYDDAPQAPLFPYVTFAQSQSRDWSTGTDSGEEHTVSLHVWSRAPGRKEAYTIIARLRELLHDQALALDGHHLVNLRHEFSEARREPDGDTYRGSARFRAVTEPLP